MVASNFVRAAASHASPSADSDRGIRADEGAPLSLAISWPRFFESFLAASRRYRRSQ